MDLSCNIGAVVSNNNYLLGLDSDLFNVAHFNAQSIAPSSRSTKIDEIRDVVSGGRLDVIGITESWLNDNIPNSAISLDGYHVHRNDRLFGRAGGVCCFISDRYKSRVIHEVRGDRDIEALFIEVFLSGVVFLIGVVYLPGGIFSACESILGDFASRYEHFVFMGDFNVNLFGGSLRVQSFCESFGVSVVHNSRPTHYCNYRQSTSLIDYFLVPNIDLVINKGQCLVPALNSCHALIHLSYNITKVLEDEDVSIRDYEHFDVEGCMQYLQGVSFDGVYDTSDTDFQAEVFTSNIIQAIDRFVPLTRLKKGTIDPWMKERSVSIAKRYRDLAKRAYLEEMNERNWQIYCRYRNRLKATIRRERARIMSSVFRRSTERQLWSKLKQVGCTGDCVGRGPLDVEEFNRSCVMPILPNMDDCISFMDRVNESGVSFRCISEDELWKAIFSIKSKSVGSDGISIVFLKKILPFLSSHLLHILNMVITSSKIPSMWKVARVIPIPKIRRPRCVNDYRPISILSVCSKILEVILKEQMMDYLCCRDMIHKFQSGFRAGCSTSSVMLSITDEIRENWDSGKLSILIFLDFSKAFDSICHNLLINRLFYKFKFSKSACRLILSFLSNRSQFVSSDTSFSSLMRLHRGVPQGSVLGPILFMLYINDLFESISVGTTHVFADDVQILSSCYPQDIDMFKVSLNACLERINEWCSLNHIVLNSGKCKAMLFYNQPIVAPPLFINNTRIEYVVQYKVLGFFIDNNLKFDSHIALVTHSVYRTLRKLYSVRIPLPFGVRLKIAHSLLMSKILYGLELFSGTSHANLCKLSCCVNRIVRFVFRLNRTQSVSSYVRDFLKCSFDDFVKFRCLLFFYRTFRHGIPAYLAEKFQFGNSSRTHTMVQVHFSTLIMQRSYQARVIRMWNTIIPYNERKFTHSVNKFRSIILENL